jgi:DNA primase
VIDRSVVDQVRQRTDLVELVGQYIPLRRAGMNWIARCPFHEERSPSFNVNAERGFYFCFGCKASGDALRFYEQIEGVNFVEALRALAERAGVELPETRDPERIAEDRRQRDVGERLAAACEAAAVYYEKCLVDAPYSELARGALSERGITDEVAARFRLGYAPARWEGLAEHLKAQRVSPADAELAGLLMSGRNGGWYDRFRHRLMFPVVDRANRVVAFSGRVLPVTEDMPEGLVPEDAGKYINSPETPLYKKSELLYGLGVARTPIRQKQEAILVEGNFDVVQMHQHGFGETVAPLGTSFTEAQAKLLRRFAENVVLAFDGDEAGRKATAAAYSVCAEAGLVARVAMLPGTMDPDSYLRSTAEGLGAEGMTALLHKAPSLVEWLIRMSRTRLRDAVPQRIAALRVIAPAIASVRDLSERNAYVAQAADTLHLERDAVVGIVREYMKQLGRPHDFHEHVSVLPRYRAGLGEFFPADGEVRMKERQAQAAIIGALFELPRLLATEGLAELGPLVDKPTWALISEARRQWEESQELSAAALLDLAPSKEDRQWLAEQLGATDAQGPEAQALCEKRLSEAVARLHRMKAEKAWVELKDRSFAAGVDGDERTEEATLNEELNLKRRLAQKARGNNQAG